MWGIQVFDVESGMVTSNFSSSYLIDSFVLTTGSNNKIYDFDQDLYQMEVSTINDGGSLISLSIIGNKLSWNFGGGNNITAFVFLKSKNKGEKCHHLMEH